MFDLLPLVGARCARLRENRDYQYGLDKGMLTIEKSVEENFCYRVSGKLSVADLREYYTALDAQYKKYGPVYIRVEVSDFRGYTGPRAMLIFLQHEPGLLCKVKSYHAACNQKWFVVLLRSLNRLTPGINITAELTS